MYNALSTAIYCTTHTYFVRIVLRPCSIIRLFLYIAGFWPSHFDQKFNNVQTNDEKKITISNAYAWQPGNSFLSLELMNNVDYIDNKWRRNTNNNNNNLFISYCVAFVAGFSFETKKASI